MLFEIASTKSLQEIDKRLQESATRHKFGIMTVHDLKQALNSKGVEYSGECIVYEVCNPLQAKRVLEANGAVSTALPCRISVYGSAGNYKLATIRPTVLLNLFNTPEAKSVADEVERALIEMMRDAA
jgi:uncharacterized protein (DUF302 family)